jgi:hypothetical protein
MKPCGKSPRSGKHRGLSPREQAWWRWQAWLGESLWGKPRGVPKECKPPRRPSPMVGPVMGASRWEGAILVWTNPAWWKPRNVQALQGQSHGYWNTWGRERDEREGPRDTALWGGPKVWCGTAQNWAILGGRAVRYKLVAQVGSHYPEQVLWAKPQMVPAKKKRAPLRKSQEWSKDVG